jgi:hypothetical protein
MRVVCAVLGAAVATEHPVLADDLTQSYSTQHPIKRFAVGYQRGTGLDNYGASFALSATQQLTPQVLVFALHDDGGTGIAVSPALQASVLDGYRHTPYVMAGLQLTQLWIGNASGRGVGGFATGGFAFRPGYGVSIELGIGLHAKQHITTTDGIVTMKQQAAFGLHWDGGVRFWF